MYCEKHMEQCPSDLCHTDQQGPLSPQGGKSDLLRLATPERLLGEKHKPCPPHLFGLHSNDSWGIHMLSSRESVSLAHPTTSTHGSSSSILGGCCQNMVISSKASVLDSPSIFPQSNALRVLQTNLPSPHSITTSMKLFQLKSEKGAILAPCQIPKLPNSLALSSHPRSLLWKNWPNQANIALSKISHSQSPLHFYILMLLLILLSSWTNSPAPMELLQLSAPLSASYLQDQKWQCRTWLRHIAQFLSTHRSGQRLLCALTTIHFALTHVPRLGPALQGEFMALLVMQLLRSSDHKALGCSSNGLMINPFLGSGVV